MTVLVPNRRPGHGGFSLLELLVAMTISGVAMFLATGLLLESESRMRRQAEENVRPVLEIALRQMRGDIRASRRAQAPFLPGWSREPLTLQGHPVGLLRYERSGNQLVRRIVEPGPAGQGGGRLVLEGLSTFRWRLRDRLVEVDLGILRIPRLRSLRRSWMWTADNTPRETRRLFWAHPRAGGEVAW